MMKYGCNGWLLTSFMILAFTTGCSERLNRENVFANTETGLGVFVAQDPKTQMYEAKIGYFRHELFFVPTSKTVTYGTQPTPVGLMQYIFGPPLIENQVLACSPDNTPEVLAEIMVDGEVSAPGSPTIKFGVRQRLAVGKVAVHSGGAAVLMADSDKEAQAALVYDRLFNPPPDLESVRTQLDDLLQKHANLVPPVEFDNGEHATGLDLAEAIIAHIFPSDLNATIDNVRNTGSVEDIRQVIAEFKKAISEQDR